MECSECGQEISLDIKVPLQIGEKKFDNGYPCPQCGRLHWIEGKPVSNSQTKRKAYWRNGRVESLPLD